jgi:hypothetical protein
VEDAFATERESVRPGEMLASVPISNRFRLLHGDPEAGAWQVRIALQWAGTAKPPGVGDRPKARPRGRAPRLETPPPAGGGPLGGAASPPAGDTLDVALTVTPPAAEVGHAESPTTRARLVLQFPRVPRPEFARGTGRAVALLVLERLHHLTDELAADERLRIDGARRLAPAPRLR